MVQLGENLSTIGSLKMHWKKNLLSKIFLWHGHL